MTETKIADLVGLSEIAEMYGVDTNTANGWRRRKDFPQIKHQLRMGPMWDREEILAWRKPIIDHRQEHPINCAWCGAGTFANTGRDQQLGHDVAYCSCGGETILMFTWHDGSLTVVACKPEEA
jgi:hypothetical protein